ncbi:RNA polymerase factor sigma-54 [Helicobacter sp. T3_23-1059]
MAQGAIRLRQNIKGKLSTTLKSWLPILQGDLSEVEEILKDCAMQNPFINIKNAREEDFGKINKISKSSKQSNSIATKSSISEKIEQLTIAKDSFYENLKSQINPPLFPTDISQQIAFDIIEGIDSEGYFREDSEVCAKRLGVEEAEYEKIRARFCYLEPRGVGAKDVLESFCFQLESSGADNDTYELCTQIIHNLSAHTQYKKSPFYEEAMKIIRSFKNPPGLDFDYEDSYKIPDIYVLEEEGNIIVKSNDEYYPIIELERQESRLETLQNNRSANLTNEEKDTQTYIKTKIKEARDLIDALEMRKATIKKVGLMIVDYQYDFFMGGEMKPMKLKDIAEELGYAPSTISRAISNKYLECQRGIFPIKSFFTTAIEGDVSNASIKDFLSEIIKGENRKKPLSDLKILKMIEEKFELKIVRRTITKYRKQLNIASSSERKKLYEIGY